MIQPRALPVIQATIGTGTGFVAAHNMKFLAQRTGLAPSQSTGSNTVLNTPFCHFQPVTNALGQGCRCKGE